VKLLIAHGDATALVDWDLPGCNGPELCRQVRARRSASPPYIIVLARTDEQIGEAFAAGADDCLNAAAGGHELQAHIVAARRLGSLA
jgi:DNA-binding response OmpR family regulator